MLVRTIKIAAASITAAVGLGLALSLVPTSGSAEAGPLGEATVQVTSPEELVSYGGGGGCQYCHDRFPRPVPDDPRIPEPKRLPPRDETGTDPDADSDSDEETDTDTDSPVETTELLGR